MRRDEFSAPAPHFVAKGTSGARPSLSVVVPLYDEEALAPALVARLTRVLDSLAVEAEVILVDDGSCDRTLAEIARAHKTDPRFVGLALSRNFGHQLAISAGLAHARGDAVVVMDGDLQDPPEAIGPLWTRLREGFDVVYAIRASRPEPFLKRLAYRAFYRLLGRVVSIDLPLDAGDFGIMTRRVVDRLVSMPERQRFLRGMRAWVGFRQTGLLVDRAARYSGRPKFTLGKLFALALDGLIGFSDAPLRPLGAIGVVVLMGSTLALIAALGRGMAGAGWAEGWHWVALLVTASVGAELLLGAILGEYVGRILQEVRGRPLYVVKRRIGIGPPRRSDRRARSRSR